MTAFLKAEDLLWMDNTRKATKKLNGHRYLHLKL